MSGTNTEMLSFNKISEEHAQLTWLNINLVVGVEFKKISLACSCTFLTFKLYLIASFSALTVVSFSLPKIWTCEGTQYVIKETPRERSCSIKACFCGTIAFYIQALWIEWTVNSEPK